MNICCGRRKIAMLVTILALSGLSVSAENLPDSKMTEPGWLSQLKDPDQRMEAQWNLRLEKDPAKVPVLVDTLSASDPELRTTILQILSESGNPALWKSIVPLLKDPDHGVRETAARALGTMGNTEAIPALIETIMEGMQFNDTVPYWILPADITSNYRYACVEALNRLAKQNFQYTRAINNFGRMYWLAEIKKWWRLQAVFKSPAFQEQKTQWRDLKSRVEKMCSSIPTQALEESSGAQEFDSCLRDMVEDVGAIASSLESPAPDAAVILDHCQRITHRLQVLDEIFVYTPEISSCQSKWQELKISMDVACKKTETFLE